MTAAFFVSMNAKKRTIEDLPIGSRILYRSKDNWRTAAVAKHDSEIATLTVCSPTGRTYRLRRKLTSEIFFDGSLVILFSEEFSDEDWKDNFGQYDQRW